MSIHYWFITLYILFQIKFPRVGDVSDLSDGLGVAALVSLYCPDHLDWSEIAGTSSSGSFSDAGSTSSMADSLFNIQLVQRFCRDVLPFNVCHLTVEDMVYLHESIRLNMVLFLADLYYSLEFRPVGLFVQRPGVKKGQNHYHLWPRYIFPLIKSITSTINTWAFSSFTFNALNFGCKDSSYRGYLRCLGSKYVAGAIPDLRPSLDNDRTTLITGA